MLPFNQSRSLFFEASWCLKWEKTLGNQMCHFHSWTMYIRNKPVICSSYTEQLPVIAQLSWALLNHHLHSKVPFQCPGWQWAVSLSGARGTDGRWRGTGRTCAAGQVGWRVCDDRHPQWISFIRESWDHIGGNRNSHYNSYSKHKANDTYLSRARLVDLWDDCRGLLSPMAGFHVGRIWNGWSKRKVLPVKTAFTLKYTKQSPICCATFPFFSTNNRRFWNDLLSLLTMVAACTWTDG